MSSAVMVMRGRVDGRWDHGSTWVIHGEDAILGFGELSLLNRRSAIQRLAERARIWHFSVQREVDEDAFFMSRLVLASAILFLSGMGAAHAQWRASSYDNGCIITSQQRGIRLSIRGSDPGALELFIPGGMGDGNVTFINEGRTSEFYLNGDGEYAAVDQRFLNSFSRSETMIIDGVAFTLERSQETVKRFYQCLATQ